MEDIKKSDKERLLLKGLYGGSTQEKKDASEFQGHEVCIMWWIWKKRSWLYKKGWRLDIRSHLGTIPQTLSKIRHKSLLQTEAL